MAGVTFDAFEAQAIARALAAVAAADGAIKAREESFLDGFAMTHAVAGHAWIAAPLDEVALARAVIGADKRREVVRLCLKMAHADRHYAEPEKALIARIARALGISDEELAVLTAEAQS
jgi:uncharacterized tellurite resistance protein B-like protein